MPRNTGRVDKCFLQVDFRNAFNTVDRAAMLLQVRLHMRGLSPWAECCYDHHSRLLFHHSPLSSEAGVQQYNPLGPLLFALALHPALQAAAAGGPELAFAFLDDSYLTGGSKQVAAGLARLTAASRQVGLKLNPSNQHGRFDIIYRNESLYSDECRYSDNL
ncbi:STRN3 [Symbiodinium natans]|uniref:STRN3 protein n=1 Tax=Symbiodinium natans TaxID=878477 RepID=A0A812QXC7_9DINO|nr:STRN3 [Symbiodinium natans]